MSKTTFHLLLQGAVFWLQESPSAPCYRKIAPVFYIDLFPGYGDPFQVTNACCAGTPRTAEDYLPFLDRLCPVFVS